MTGDPRSYRLFPGIKDFHAGIKFSFLKKLIKDSLWFPRGIP
jgi:hypothetical protein